MAAEMAEEPQPDIDGIIRDIWRKRMFKMLRQAFRHAHELDDQNLQKCLDAAIEASHMSGAPSSNDIDIIQKVRKARYYGTLESANDFAARGLYWWAEQQLEMAATTAEEAGLPAPDRDGIMQQAMRVWLDKERAARLGNECDEYRAPHVLEETKHAEQKPDKQSAALSSSNESLS